VTPDPLLAKLLPPLLASLAYLCYCIHMAKRKPREVPVVNTIPDEPNLVEDHVVVAEIREAELFDEAPPVAITPFDDDIPALDSDLTQEEKLKFTALLNKAMPLAVRAQQLAKLAQFTDTKRAAVGLRAIQEINSLTGVSRDLPTEAAPMFQLPKGTSVSVTLQKVEK